MGNDQVKVAAQNLNSKCFACELWVKRVGTFGVVLNRNQWSVNFILHSAELHIGSSIRYLNALYGNYFLNCYIVKRILISFNCFSEYISNPHYEDNAKVKTQHIYVAITRPAQGLGAVVTNDWCTTKNGEKKSDKAARGHGLLRKEKLWHFSPRKPGVGSQIRVVGNVSDYTADPGVMS